MRIEKKFWFRDKKGSKSAFSYDKDDQPAKFAARWGGSVIDYLEVDEDVASVLDNETELYSIIATDNPKPTEENAAKDSKRFKIFVLKNGSFTEYDEGHVYLKDANTKAKNIASSFEKVIVVRKRVTEVDDDPPWENQKGISF